MKTRFFVISGPSGVGKSSIIRELRTFYEEHFPLNFAVSHTTRDARRNKDGVWEIHGKDYYFVDVPAFLRMISRGELLEHTNRYGQFYGTSKAEVERLQAAGIPAILDVDVLGGLKVKELYPDQTDLIFIAPPSLEELQKRLLERSPDGDADTEDLQRRMDAQEVALQSYIGHRYYNHIITNTRLESTVAKIANEIITPRLNSSIFNQYDPEFGDSFPIPYYNGSENL